MTEKIIKGKYCSPIAVTAGKIPNDISAAREEYRHIKPKGQPFLAGTTFAGA